MERNHVAGTLRYYGTPAEEGGDGKVYMIRAGLFRDVDVVLEWHPGSANEVMNGGMLAINTARFLFHGVAAHAAMAPDRGRSALDAVMLMGNGIEFLREHIPSNSRIHYIITNGGAAPNIVPDTAELYLYARNPSSPVLAGIWDRILKIGQGAALMTETTLEVIDVGGDANVLPNDALAKVAQRNLEEVGGFRYTAEEKHFAEELQKSLPAGGAGDLDSTAFDSAPSAAGSQRSRRLDGCRGRQLERADHRFHHGDIRARSGPAHLAGGCHRGHEHRPKGDDRRGKSAGGHRRGFVFGSPISIGCQSGFPATDARQDLSVGHTRRPEAAVELPKQIGSLLPVSPLPFLRRGSGTQRAFRPIRAPARNPWCHCVRMMVALFTAF